MFENFKFIWKSLTILTLSIVFVFVASLIYKNQVLQPEYIQPFVKDDVCNVATIPIAGMMGVHVIGEGSEDVSNTISLNGDLDNLLWKLDSARLDDSIKAVTLQVDSYGGQGPVGEILSTYLSKYSKPVVAYIHEAGLSNAYWSILPAKYIVAHKTSSVGSVGVAMSYISNVKKNEQEGLDFISISSGAYKDVGSPDKKLSSEEKEYFLNEIKKFAQVFKADVAKYRNLGIATVESFSDGKSFMGTEALALGLIDEVGDEQSVINC